MGYSVLEEYKLVGFMIAFRVFTSKQAQEQTGLTQESVVGLLPKYNPLLHVDESQNEETHYAIKKSAIELWQTISEGLYYECLARKLFTDITEEYLEAHYDDMVMGALVAMDLLESDYNEDQALAERRRIVNLAALDCTRSRLSLEIVESNLPEAPRTLELKAQVIRARRLIAKKRLELDQEEAAKRISANPFQSVGS